MGAQLSGHACVRLLLEMRGWTMDTAQHESAFTPGQPSPLEWYVLPGTAWRCSVGARSFVLFKQPVGGVATNVDSASPDIYRIDAIDAIDAIKAKLDEIGQHLPPPAPIDIAYEREALGQMVHAVWLTFCRETGETKPSALAPWEALGAHEREGACRIGETLFQLGVSVLAQTLARERFPLARDVSANGEVVWVGTPSLAEACAKDGEQ